MTGTTMTGAARRLVAVAGAGALALTTATAALAHPDPGQPTDDLHRHDPAETLEQQDTESALLDVISDGPTGTRTKHVEVAGVGERAVADATTDVWALDRYAWIGTFNQPCGTGAGFSQAALIDDVEAAGIPTFDVRNKTKPAYVGNLPSVEGSRVNDVKVATMNSGDVLVHSNESCAGGPGGFEVYDVDDPTAPVHLASVRMDELNPISNSLFGGIADVGVHNLFLFTQGDRDYVAAVAESAFDNFRIFDITDPSDPTLVSAWGAEEIFDPGVGDETTDVDRVLDAALDLLDGVGSSQNKFLHDITISDDGTKAYLSNWDAGLVLLDIDDPADPALVSQAFDVAGGSLDSELNSHAAWPSEDGSIVVETEEDFDAWEGIAPPSNLTFGEDDPPAPLPGSAISTGAGDQFEDSQTDSSGTLDTEALTVTSGALAGETFAAIELAGDQPKLSDVGPITGDIVFIGRGCDGDEILNTEALTVDSSEIAVVRRGDCSFREKNVNAAAAGADAVVIANNLEGTPWSGVRIWDYADPANPVLASTFNTDCSAASEPIEGCDPAGVYSVHNVIVETRGNKVLAYLSWYWDGMLVLDVTDPYNPVEVARFDQQPAETGLPHDFWGVYKIPNEPFFYGSDRNNGLYVFKLLGPGAGNRG